MSEISHPPVAVSGGALSSADGESLTINQYLEDTVAQYSTDWCSVLAQPDRSRKARKKIEMLFAHLKRILKLDRLRLRGPSGARDEFLLAATAQNL